ncbi:hypothetical protein DFH09DRAFT_1086400 [Mycena vulgaris]|nr:hypothetical protein DFH09DRAFT_1086400 [Mycena vulgaris]
MRIETDELSFRAHNAALLRRGRHFLSHSQLQAQSPSAASASFGLYAQGAGDKISIPDKEEEDGHGERGRIEIERSADEYASAARCRRRRVQRAQAAAMQSLQYRAPHNDTSSRRRKQAPHRGQGLRSSGQRQLPQTLLPGQDESRRGRWWAKKVAAGIEDAAGDGDVQMRTPAAKEDDVNVEVIKPERDAPSESHPVSSSVPCIYGVSMVKKREMPGL